jgi:hypothetical protein
MEIKIKVQIKLITKIKGNKYNQSKIIILNGKSKNQI